MKLELKHLAPYLPYGLRVINLVGEIETVFSLSTNRITSRSSDTTSSISLEDSKPILRPLSDLTKEIEQQDGILICPINQFLEDNYNFEYLEDLEDLRNTLVDWSLGVNAMFTRMDEFKQYYDFLMKWHFDAFGLIDAGIGIDINTLN